jgi:cytochrome c-type biogenesis protein CcmH/NrfF
VMLLWCSPLLALVALAALLLLRVVARDQARADARAKQKTEAGSSDASSGTSWRA